MDRFFGYIEGYYGAMLSWEERRFVCDRMESLGLNTYVYAPKEDPFHRLEWKTSYPSSWIESFRIFIKEAARKGISVIPCMAPGLSFDYTKLADYSLLLKKMSVFADIGGRTVALLMDDIPAVLRNRSGAAYSSLGHAHGALVSRLQSDLRKRCPRLRMWFCPTVYANQFAPEGIEHSPYLTDLALTLPSDVQIMWTGPEVISGALDSTTLGAISRLFSGNVVVWDNLYANDYCPHKLFAGPYLGRSRSALQTVNGVLLNPTGMPHTDSLLLGLLAGYKNGLTPQQAWRNTAAEAGLTKDFAAVSRFFLPPNVPVKPGKLTKAYISRIRKALGRLVWNWKSPLQREWYPFLYMLDTDLALAEKAVPSKDRLQWIAKKYPPVLSAVLSASNRRMHV